MASVAVIGMNRNRPLRRRMSRVPVSWSMMPAAMNSDALKVAWLMVWKIAATAASGLPRPEQERDQAEMADGRIGQQALQVLLEDGREIGAEQQRAEAGRHHDAEPGFRAGQHRPEPGEQEHAGLHHRGRVEIGRDRRRRGHGVRQPEVERELGALGQGAEQDQDQGRQVEAAARGSDRPRPAPGRDRSCRRCGRSAGRPTSRHSPPVAVTVSAMRAPSRALALWCQ